ncbi:MAG: hypothetical protein R3B07_34355 [Polyangiaceae bacterium]
MLVKLVKKPGPNGEGLWGVTLDRTYEVLGIEADDYRLLTDPETEPYGNDPILYPPECFQIIDPAEPEFWESRWGEDGERYARPKAWNEPGFFEDFHDRVEEVRARFWEDVRTMYPYTWAERQR